jgi:hypothetical protein
MGSIVKSIGKAIKGIGKLIKKAAPYILMAVALYAGIAAYGAYAAGGTMAAASTAAAVPGAAAGAPFLSATAAQSTAYIASTSANAVAAGNLFSYANFQSGTKLIGANISKMTGTGTGNQTALGQGTPTGTSILTDTAGALGGGTGPTTTAATTAAPAVVPTGSESTGIMNWISTAIDGNQGYALIAGAQLLGTGISAIAAAYDDSDEQQLALAKEKLALAEKELKQRGTRYGFAPGEGRTPDEMPADSPFWMGYNQNLAMNAGAPTPGGFAHGIKQPTTSNRRTLNYNYSPRGVVTQSAAKTFNQRPTGMININNKPGVLNA